MEWPFHSQDLRTSAKYKRMIETLFEVERDTNPGVDVDSYMVVYKDTYGVYKHWEKYDGLPISRGTFHVLFENRDGGNYQMFDMAYQLIKHRYDWFIFTCDDIMILGDQYYQKILNRWRVGVGYVALQGIGENEEGQNHVQGSIGLTSKKILEQVCAINGGELPHSKKTPWTQDNNITEGEIPFTKKILGLGYRFVNYNNSVVWLKENLCYPYYDYIKR